jgi:hypothetical protein
MLSHSSRHPPPTSRNKGTYDPKISIKMVIDYTVDTIQNASIDLQDSVHS